MPRQLDNATPAGPWVMVQRWHDLLFAHWRCSVDELRPRLPSQLEIDTCDGSAWIGVIPFYMSGVRVRAMPPVPTAHAFAEINVRTYVTLDGRPGVWFFSLDCASMLAVIGARVGIHLPYFRAAMTMTRHDETITYHSRRWAMGRERYCLYASDGKRIWRGDIVHPPWSLQAADAAIEHNSMIAAAGLRARDDAPLLHFSAFQDVRFWWPTRVR